MSSDSGSMYLYLRTVHLKMSVEAVRQQFYHEIGELIVYSKDQDQTGNKMEFSHQTAFVSHAVLLKN